MVPNNLQERFKLCTKQHFFISIIAIYRCQKNDRFSTIGRRLQLRTDVKKPALGGLLLLLLPTYFADLRRDAAKPSSPRLSKAMLAGSGTLLGVLVELAAHATVCSNRRSASPIRNPVLL